MTESATAVQTSRGPGYVIWGAVCLVISIVGFWPTFVAPSMAGAYSSVAPTMPWHVLSTTLWLVLVISQPTLISFGNVRLHQLIGIVGSLVAVGVVVTGVVVQLEVMGPYLASGDSANGALTPFFRLVTMVVYAICVAAAIAFRGRPAWHKRLMILGTFSLLEAPLGRIFLHILRLGDWSGLLAAVFHFVLMAAFVIWDRRAQGRFHPVSVWSAVVTTVVIFGTAPIAFSDWWQGAAARLAGY